MRMICKYTSFNDYDENFKETDKSWYLSFVKKDDVIDIPFDNREEMEKMANKYTLKDFISSEKFLNEIKEFDDFKDFFGDIDVLVFYGNDIHINLKEILSEDHE